MSPVLTKKALPSVEFIVAEYQALGIAIVKAGKSYKTLCPFPDHLDSHPSFFVYSDGGYHCFGCGAHGSLEDIYAFYDKDFNYHPSRIDLTTVRNSVIEFMPQLRKNFERRMRLSVAKIDGDCFGVYDLFDRMWIDACFIDFTSRLHMIMAMKREFFHLLQSLEVNYE